MVHGLPDWGLRGPKATTYGLDDLGEAVARLGSPVVWDRRGDVIVIESFEGSGGTWDPAPYGFGASIHRTCGGAHTGAYGVELQAGSDGEHSAQVSLVNPAVVQGPSGFEAWFGVAADTEAIRLFVYYYTGTQQYRSALYYGHVTGNLFVATTGGVWQQIASGLALHERYEPRHVAKLVVDFSTGYYARVILDDVTYLVHDIPIHIFGDPTNAQVIGVVSHVGVVGKNPKVAVDDLILTQNEPVSI